MLLFSKTRQANLIPQEKRTVKNLVTLIEQALEQSHGQAQIRQ
jgi:hypothetical protein